MPKFGFAEINSVRIIRGIFDLHACSPTLVVSPNAIINPKKHDMGSSNFHFSRLSFYACGVKMDPTSWGWSRWCQPSRRTVRWHSAVWMTCCVTHHQGGESLSPWWRTGEWAGGLLGPYSPLCCWSDGSVFSYIYYVFFIDLFEQLANFTLAVWTLPI